MQEDASSVPLASQILGNLAPGLRRDILDVAWSPDGRTLATVDMSLALTLWTDEGKTRREVGKVAGGSDCLAFLDHGREILTPIGKVEVPSGPEAANGAFTIWKLDTPAILRHVDKPSEDIGKRTQFRHCRVSPDERFFAVIADSPPYHVAIYSTDNWKVQRTVHFPDRPRGVYVPDALAFSPDSRLLAIGASDKIFLASLDDQARPLDVIATYRNPANVGLGMGTDALAFNLDGSLLASAANGPNPPDHSLQPVDPIQVWRVQDHSRVSSWTGDFLARDLAWSADGRHVVAGTTNGIRAFAPLAPTEAPQVVYAGNSIFALASPDGRWLAVWGANKVTVFDISR